jgi:hypothetical protein
MRLTVGPLPPAVYWRRRAVVLGAVLVVIVLFAYSCGGSGKSDASTKTGSTSSSSPEPSAPADSDSGQTASESPSAEASADASPSTDSGTGGNTGTDEPSVDPTLCTNDEMLLTPVPATKQLPAGATLQLTLKIKNKSARTCRRDVGADLQELYIVVRGGAQKVWSSDDCGGPHGHDMESFTPSFERSYSITWNGLYSTSCKGQDSPPPGEYQLYGRLGTERSSPVTLTLT